MASPGITLSLENLGGEVDINPSAWRYLNPSSYSDVGRFLYRAFKF
jgi:hypothetical protein